MMIRLMTIALATSFIFSLSSMAETKSEKNKREERETLEREAKEEKKRVHFRKVTVPKIEQFFDAKYVAGQSSKRQRLERSFKALELKVKKNPKLKKKYAVKMASIGKKLELIYLYEDYYNTFVAMNVALDKTKDYKGYRENYKKLRAYQAQYKKLTNEKFPNIGEEYQKSQIK